MADIRINALANTATTPASDDYLALDGSAQGTRKILATNIANNVTDVILGTSGPSVKSTLSARAPRQGLVFDGTAGATVASVPAFGTSNYSFAVWVLYKTSSSPQALFDSGVNGCVFSIAANGQVLLYDRKASATRAASTTLLTAGKSYFLAYSRTGQIYINGVADGAQVADGSDYTSTTAFIGKSYANTEFCFGSISGPLIYNRALSASEVVSLYEAGAPSGADYGASGVPASNTSLITGDNSTFASDTGWWAKNNSTIGGGVATLNASGATIYRTSLLTVGKRYRVTWTVVSGQAYLSDSSSSVSPTRSAGTYTEEFIATSASYFGVIASGGSASVDNITLFPIGLLLAPDAAQAGGGLTWYDTSGNAANITLPASGVSWNVPFAGYVTAPTTTNLTLAGGSSGASLVLGQGANGAPTLAAAGSGTPTITKLGAANGARRVALNLQTGADGTLGPVNIELAAYPSATGSQRYGSLSVGDNGAWRPLVLQHAGGNVLVGATADGGNGIIQLATGAADKTSGIGFGTDVSLYRDSANYLAIQTSTSTSGFHFYEGASMKGGISTTSGSMYLATYSATSILLQTNGTTALTLDSSQNATFAGTITSSVARTAGASFLFSNTDNTTGTSSSRLWATTGGGTGGDPILTLTVTGATDWTLGVDNSDSDKFKINNAFGLGTSDKLVLDGSGNMTIAGSLTTSAPTGGAGAWELGVYSATAPTATGYVTIEIGGVQYKLLAST